MNRFWALITSVIMEDKVLGGFDPKHVSHWRHGPIQDVRTGAEWSVLTDFIHIWYIETWRVLSERIWFWVALIQIMLAIDVMVQFSTSKPAQNDQFCQISFNFIDIVVQFRNCPNQGECSVLSNFVQFWCFKRMV